MARQAQSRPHLAEAGGPPRKSLEAQDVRLLKQVIQIELDAVRNDAAVEHCRRANAGLYYANRDEFVDGMKLLMTNSRLRERLGGIKPQSSH